MPTTPFDEAAATWDEKPRRIALTKDIGQKILDEAKPTADADVLDYGCGTGLLGFYLLPHVRSVTGADNSTGMLDVLRKKIAERGLDNMKAVHLDLVHDPYPTERYDTIVTAMTMHHIADLSRVLRSFHEMLNPAGTLCIADLDTENGSFHHPDSGESVHHNGFDRQTLKQQLLDIGFANAKDTTASTIRKEIASGAEEEFPVFLITATVSSA
jgi:2-polyprenyl-3-methyl-5-hydroxy-6-metoxy-1,4-benzoquinol methylase